MKNYMLLILISGILFGTQIKAAIEDERDLTLKTAVKTTEKKEISKKTEKIINLGKNSHCSTPTGRHQFYEINSKGEYRTDIKFKYCMFNNVKYENIIVGIIVKDLNAVKDYIKKYTYLHFREGSVMRESVEKVNYYYDNSWAWSSSSAYPSTLFEKSQDKNK